MNTHDSIKKLLSDLSQYSTEDFYNNLPYERAATLCTTREELEDCLSAISAEASGKGVDKNAVDAYYFMCLQDYMLGQGESLIPIELPPEEDQNNLEEYVGEVFDIDIEELKDEQGQLILIDGQPQEDIIKQKRPRPGLPNYLEEDEVHSITLGGRTYHLVVGRYHYSGTTGSVSVSDPKDNIELLLCYHFVVPVAITQSSSGETIDIVYYRDSKWYSIPNIKKSDLYNENGGAKYLMNLGVDVDLFWAGWVANYFLDMERMNRNKYIPIYRAPESLGWQNERYSIFAPYGQFKPAGNKSNCRLFESIQSPAGSFKDWIDAISTIRDDNHIIARIIVAASFASILIRPLKGMRFAVNLIGASGLGKSVGLRVAASIWGNPDVYIASFGSTTIGALQRSNYLFDLPLILDESETKKNQSDYDEFIYTMCSEYERLKANGGDELPVSMNCIFISGEHPLMQVDSNKGAKNRVLDIICRTNVFFPPEENKPFVEKTDRNYGHAGREFVHRLTNRQELDNAKEIYSQYLDAFPGNRQARIPAAILTADRLIEKWFFKDGIQLKPEDILTLLRQSQEIEKQAMGYAAIHIKIRNWIDTEGIKDPLYGSVRDRRKEHCKMYVFADNVLKNKVEEFGGEFNEYLAWAETQKVLVCSGTKGHRNQVQINIKNTNVWRYAIYI